MKQIDLCGVCAAKMMGGENVEKEIVAIKEKLAVIEALLQQLPEYQAAVFLQMWEEYQTGKLFGKKFSDMFTILPPGSR